MQQMKPLKKLGQHWLKDQFYLNSIVESADIRGADQVLEIGPGLGALTYLIYDKTKHLTLVEFDRELAIFLKPKFPELVIHNQDVLKFDFGTMPQDYKIIANMPYYISGKFLRQMTEITNKPRVAVLLLQKEVVERVVSAAGDMNAQGIFMQLYYEVAKGVIVPPIAFEPPPKVDSQVLILKKRAQMLYPISDIRLFERLIKAGFCQPRKMLRGTLSAGLGISKQQADVLCGASQINPQDRPEAIGIDLWYNLYQQLEKEQING
jgi:16S rRNA (adenine1518-N6/adenine1519-N6)-dimethyltransferase